MTRLLLALVTAALAGPAATVPADYPKSILGDRVAGAPVDCIDLLDTDAIHIGSGGTVYELRTGKIFYYNRPTVGVGFLHEGVVLLIDRAYPRLCSGQLVRIVNLNSHLPLAAVTLGAFVPYRRADKP